MTLFRLSTTQELLRLAACLPACFLREPFKTSAVVTLLFGATHILAPYDEPRELGVFLLGYNAVYYACCYGIGCRESSYASLHTLWGSYPLVLISQHVPRVYDRYVVLGSRLGWGRRLEIAARHWSWVRDTLIWEAAFGIFTIVYGRRSWGPAWYSTIHCGNCVFSIATTLLLQGWLSTPPGKRDLQKATIVAGPGLIF
jgi:hypothetical protein